MDRHTPVQIPSLMLGGSLWALRPDALATVLRLARVRLSEARAGELQPAAPQAAAIVDQPTSTPGVAVIPLTGVLTPHGSLMSFLFGGGGNGVQGFRDQLARAVGDPEIGAIVLDIDSPGGTVGMVPEAAADVRAAREIKPVLAVVNVQACSGAYWIASQADELYASPSGIVGSVGVYYVHEDWSGFNEQAGIDVSYIYAGKYKIEGNPDEPLSDDAREAWQADADKLYASFLDDVAAGRRVTAAKVRSDYGEGRALLATDAEAAGIVDGIDTLQAVIGRALAGAATTGGAAARRLGRTLAERIAAGETVHGMTYSDVEDARRLMAERAERAEADPAAPPAVPEGDPAAPEADPATPPDPAAPLDVEEHPSIPDPAPATPADPAVPVVPDELAPVEPPAEPPVDVSPEDRELLVDLEAA